MTVASSTLISSQQRAQLDCDGFTILPNLFSKAEMVALESAVMNHHLRCAQTIRDNPTEGGLSRPGEITFTCHLAEQDEAIRAFCLREEFVAISTELLGPDVDLYWNQSVFKEPETQREFPWHQDDGYAQVDPSPYLTLWLALSDATADNGCLSVLPGFHRRGLMPHVDSPIGLVCHSVDDPNQGVQVPVNSGSLVAMWSLTPHKSGVNRSRSARNAYVIQYSRAGLRNVSTGEIYSDKIPVARNGLAIPTI